PSTKTKCRTAAYTSTANIPTDPQRDQPSHWTAFTPPAPPLCRRSVAYFATAVHIIFIHEYGCRKPKLADAGGNLSNLLLRMCTGVFWVRPDLPNRQVCVPVRHGEARFAGARALTRMGRQNQ